MWPRGDIHANGTGHYIGGPDDRLHDRSAVPIVGFPLVRIRQRRLRMSRRTWAAPSYTRRGLPTAARFCLPIRFVTATAAALGGQPMTCSGTHAGGRPDHPRRRDDCERQPVDQLGTELGHREHQNRNRLTRRSIHSIAICCQVRPKPDLNIIRHESREETIRERLSRPAPSEVAVCFGRFEGCIVGVDLHSSLLPRNSLVPTT